MDAVSELEALRQRNGMLERKLSRVTSALEELEAITETRTRELYDANISLVSLGDRLSSFLPDQIRRLMEEGEDSAANLVATRRYITIIFGDLSGFTSIAEVLDPEAVTEIVNEYFEAVFELVVKHGGLLDKFIGDGFMAFWGAPESAGQQNDAVRCARFGIEMRDRFKKLAESWSKRGIDHQISLRQAIHSGYCSVGNFGTQKRLQFTAMGNPVNVTARLEGEAEPGSVLMSLTTQSMVSPYFDSRPKGKLIVKGIKHPISTFELLPKTSAAEAENEPAADQVTAFLNHLEGTSVFDRKTMEALRELARSKMDGVARPLNGVAKQAESAWDAGL